MINFPEILNTNYPAYTINDLVAPTTTFTEPPDHKDWYVNG